MSKYFNIPCKDSGTGNICFVKYKWLNFHHHSCRWLSKTSKTSFFHRKTLLGVEERQQFGGIWLWTWANYYSCKMSCWLCTVKNFNIRYIKRLGYFCWLLMLIITLKGHQYTVKYGTWASLVAQTVKNLLVSGREGSGRGDRDGEYM